MIEFLLFAMFATQVAGSYLTITHLKDRNDELTEALDAAKRANGIPAPLPKPIKTASNRPKLPEFPTAM